MDLNSGKSMKNPFQSIPFWFRFHVVLTIFRINGINTTNFSCAIKCSKFYLININPHNNQREFTFILVSFILSNGHGRQSNGN